MINDQLVSVLGSKEKAQDAINFVSVLLKVEEDVAEGYLVGLINGYGTLRNEISVSFPEIVKANLTGKVDDLDKKTKEVVASAKKALEVGEELKEKKEPEKLTGEDKQEL